jgi:Outer membrane lipoprotein-sorting protein
MNWLMTGMLLLVLPNLDGSASELSPTEILRIADQARGNVSGILWQVSLETTGGKKDHNMALEVRGRGFDIHAKTLSPARNKGDLLLMVKGNMWFYKPGLSKPVPISRRQKLMGDAAFGDIAATNYAEDYEVVSMEPQSLEGVPCYVFQLHSINKKTTYDNIQYWVESERLVGIRAEYMTVSGKMFKTATMEYEQSVEQQGEPRPFLSAIRIENDLMDEQLTWIRFGEADIRSMPDSLFNLNLLRE